MKSKGFTLIEVMVVIAVMAILIAVTLPSMATYRAHQLEIGRANQEEVLNKALKQYYALEGHYPRYADFQKADGTFDSEAFAVDMKKKTGTIVNLNDYVITYIESPPSITVTLQP